MQRKAVGKGVFDGWWKKRKSIRHEKGEKHIVRNEMLEISETSNLQTKNAH